LACSSTITLIATASAPFYGTSKRSSRQSFWAWQLRL
jgi:hypothetical protein